MRFYLILLSEIHNQTADEKFFKQVFSKKWEWWRYFPLSIILATPQDVYTNTLIAMLTESYGPSFFTVMEIDIKDVGGVMPGNKKDLEKGKTPLSWFYHLRDPKYIPKWERENDKAKEETK